MKNEPKILGNIWHYILLAFVIVSGILIFRWVRSKNNSQRLIDEELAEDCSKANNEFDRLKNFQRGYFSNNDLTRWKIQYSELFNKVANRSIKSYFLSSEKIELIESFNRNYSQGEQIRRSYNDEFIPHELDVYEQFFANIQGVSLDKQQRIAIVTNEDNNLIVAGAGSGKTTTLMGKVNYIIDRYNVPADKILLISFTDKSASTIAKRINIPGVEAKTFHKFGLDVIAEVEGSKPSIFDTNQFKNLLSQFLKQEMSDPKYTDLVTKYFLEYLKIPKPQEQFETQGEYLQYLRDQNFSTYKVVESNYNGKTTYRKEVVKSIEECKIANFLFFNSIQYEYEKKYEFNTATLEYSQYKPDFTIINGNDRIYLEHFALNRDNQVPPFFANREDKTHEEATKEYLSGIEWKRNIHATNKTILIESYSYEMNEGTLYDNLSKNLKILGIELNPKSPEEIWKIISTNSEDEVKSFIDLLATFITLTKSNNFSFSDIIERNKINKEGFIYERNQVFVKIARPIFERYQRELFARKEIDFNDMINRAADYINSKQYSKLYSYVIIDEFQDISIGRYHLVKALKDSNPNCRLFCVGDDWQSIYRFTGSDISLYKEFNKYFGFTANSKIETTYRFCNPLIATSSDFILKNKNQSAKVLNSVFKDGETKYKVVYSTSDERDDTETLQQIFDELFEFDKNIHNKEIFILGRYTFDLSTRIKNVNGNFVIEAREGLVKYRKANSSGNVQELKAKYLTIHKAKGLEADYIIIINCNSGKFGLPSEKSDDPVLNLLLSEADQFENGEERRLFYVAMTRAKEQVFFVSDCYNPSKFITELDSNNPSGDIRKCPTCKTANLALRQGVSQRGNYWAFWGCTNFKYGCKFQQWIS